MNYSELTALLRQCYDPAEATAIARLVMSDRFGLTLTDLALGKDTLFSIKEREDLENIAQMLAAGVPVQQVLGHADFCGRRFELTPDVLIPRPETEELVQWVLADLAPGSGATSAPSAPSVADLGTGSGCIATTIALGLPHGPHASGTEPHVVAVDISGAALDVARGNARRLGADVGFLQADMLLTDALCAELPMLDVIVSNPPYIRASEAAEMAPHVLRHEPHLALFVPDADPLRFYRAIALVGQRRLKAGGRIYVELNRALAAPTASLFARLGFAETEVRRDLFGNERMLRASRSVNNH